MKTFKDLTGIKFGKLLALEPTDRREPTNGTVKWLCLCDCGRKHLVNSNNLVFEQVKSCGCSKGKKVRR